MTHADRKTPRAGDDTTPATEPCGCECTTCRKGRHCHRFYCAPAKPQEMPCGWCITGVDCPRHPSADEQPSPPSPNAERYDVEAKLDDRGPVVVFQVTGHARADGWERLVETVISRLREVAHGTGKEGEG